MSQSTKRGIISIVIFSTVFLLGGPIISGQTESDADLKAIFYLSGIIAAGCYWIGSNRKD